MPRISQSAGIEGNTEVQPDQYSTIVGLLYFFNIIVGTGALTLPSAFQHAGYILGPTLLLISGFFSYLCATFVFESICIANLIIDNKMRKNLGIRSCSSAQTDSSESLQFNRRIEVSEMAELFLGRLGVLFAFFLLAFYLFADLGIYSASVSKSLMNILCSSINSSLPLPSSSELPCYGSGIITRFSMYRVCVALFVLTSFPMILAGMVRMRHLQLATTFMRWIAFMLMIILASLQLLKDGPGASPTAININGFGSLFGVSVYSFMCHHSIPGLVSPIREKTNFYPKLLGVYTLIFIFYSALSLTGTYAYPTVFDIYTLNFYHDAKTGGIWWFIVDYFLALFPVFTLTSSYIIVSITLTNNMNILVSWGMRSVKSLSNSNFNSASTESEALLNHEPDQDLQSENSEPAAPPILVDENRTQFFQNSTLEILPKLLLPLFVVSIPTLISIFTDNVLFLASITGFIGVGVQYVIPTILILSARRMLKQFPDELTLPLNYKSPFTHWIWPYLIFCWTTFAILITSLKILT